MYKFRLYSRNTVGLSLPASISVLAAQVPDQPLAPITAVTGSGLSVSVSWIAPYDGDSPLTQFKVLIRHADEVSYSEELTDCDGSDPTILATRSCIISISLLRSAPFYLEWGVSVYAKVIATNIVGDSLASSAGNGAVILTVPDSPINL